MNRKALKVSFSSLLKLIALVFFVISFSCSKQNSPMSVDSNISSTKASYGSTIVYAPSSLPSGPLPLVVAIHGCFQSASDYRSATGFNDLADRFGFVVMYPHKLSGSIGNCWDRANTSTGLPYGDMNYILGEIDDVKASHNIDSNRIFVTGLSSGGGLTVCFAEHHGDKIAGFAPMAAPTCASAQGSPSNIKMIIWHSPTDSASDGTQHLSRFGARYSGASKTITNSQYKPGHSGHSYDAYTKDGEEVVGLITISMSHGISVDPGTGEDQGGNSGMAYTYDKGIHSSYYSAKFWGILVSDDVDPIVNITSPSNGSTVSGSVTVNATASDDDSVTKVEFYVNGALKSTDTTSPYSVNWDTSSEYNGQYSIVAKAYDPAGNTAESSVQLNVTGGATDTTAPIVNITAPSNGSTVSETVTISASATDVGTGVVKVEFYLNTTKIGEDTTAPYEISWDSSSVADGSYTIKAKAIDGASNEATDDDTSITVQQFSQQEYTDTNYNHKSAGRAYVSGLVYYYAVGSNDSLGIMGQTTTLCETSSGHFVLGACEGGGDPDPDPDPDPSCFTSTNTVHSSANRADYKFVFGKGYGYVANGSNDWLGSFSTTTTSLSETSPGNFEKVTSCP